MALDQIDSVPAGATHIDMGEEQWVQNLADHARIDGSAKDDTTDDGLDGFVAETLKGKTTKQTDAADSTGDDAPQRGADGKFLPKDGQQTESAARRAESSPRSPVPYFHPDLIQAARAEGLNPDRYDNPDKLENDIWRSQARRARQAAPKEDDLPEPKFDLPSEEEIDNPKVAKAFKGLAEHNAALTKALRAERAERQAFRQEMDEIRAQQRDSEERMNQTQRASTTRMLDDLYERSDDSVKEYLARPSEALGGKEGEEAERVHRLGEYMKDRFDGLAARGEEPDLAALWEEGVRALFPDLLTKKTTKELQRKLDKGRGGTAARSAPRQTPSGRGPTVFTDRSGAIKAWRADLRAQGVMD
jgi:hypothetical protein